MLTTKESFAWHKKYEAIIPQINFKEVILFEAFSEFGNGK
jgi:hypothetical protein